MKEAEVAGVQKEREETEKGRRDVLAGMERRFAE